MSNANKGGRTRFRKGNSANPGGRPAGYGEMREYARQHTFEMIDTLVGIARDKTNKQAAAKAASDVLARGWGQPEQGLRTPT
jgi:hypothetical protein